MFDFVSAEIKFLKLHGFKVQGFKVIERRTLAPCLDASSMSINM